MMYSITKIRMSDNKIDAVEIRNFLDKDVIIGIWSVNEIISLLLKGNVFVTAIYKNNKWVEGSKLHIVSKDDITFIQSKPDEYLFNNLGELPEILAS